MYHPLVKAGDAGERLAGAGARPLITVEPHGTLVVREPSREGEPPRRVLELDRRGTVLAALHWTDEGRLGHAWIRIADDSWVMIEPRATREPAWGVCDRLWLAAHPSAAARVPLTIFEALVYEGIDRIPALAEPAHLPAGAGTAVLNLIAALAADSGRSRLAYRGPYPTEELFLALLGSFRYYTAELDPLAAFMAGGVEWSPAPYERVLHASGVTVHLRERIETVAWRGRFYHRPDWQGVLRHASRNVRDVDGGVVCSLRALGEVVEDHLRLDPEGMAVEVLAPARRAIAESRSLPAKVMAGVGSVVAALGIAPLGPFVREIAAGCELSWAPLEGDLAAVDDGRLGVSHAVRETLARQLSAATTRAQRLGLGLAAVTELAQLFGDALRALAQARLASLPPAVQARLLAEPESPAGSADDARRIAEAVEALIADAAEEFGGRV